MAKQWQVQHPHPENLEAGEEIWFEGETLEQAQNYAKSGYKCRSREVTEWKEDDPNA